MINTFFYLKQWLVAPLHHIETFLQCYYNKKSTYICYTVYYINYKIEYKISEKFDKKLNVNLLRKLKKFLQNNTFRIFVNKNK